MVVQAYLKGLDSRDPPTLASLVTGALSLTTIPAMQLHSFIFIHSFLIFNFLNSVLDLSDVLTSDCFLPWCWGLNLRPHTLTNKQSVN